MGGQSGRGVGVIEYIKQYIGKIFYNAGYHDYESLDRTIRIYLARRYEVESVQGVPESEEAIVAREKYEASKSFSFSKYHLFKLIHCQKEATSFGGGL